MNTDKKYKHEELTRQIISCFYNTYNTLGYGFLEKVYENSFRIVLEEKGFYVKQQVPIKVYFQDRTVGDYFADLIINDLVLIEIKAQEILVKENEAQLLNYLKATSYEVGLLLNFGIKPEVRRKIFDNELK